MNLSNPNNLLIAGVYYVLVAVLTFFSIFGVYILIRYGKSRPLALSIALVYGFFFLKILVESYGTLQVLLS
jgi:hypothetical protein